MAHILKVSEKKEEKFLRNKTKPFPFPAEARRVRELVFDMKQAMQDANGIGLSANQIGLETRVFVAQVPDQNGHLKFYAIFNPEVVRASEETSALEEGCLSVPGLYGEVERPERITLAGFDKNGRPIKIKAWGLLARVFQHEIDHLNGKLFIDKAKHLHEAPTSERLKRQEEKIGGTRQ
ncbi:MAG: peptide deformylase [Candidatus Liptonbacteria bacterium]|nr:peptide deformylase [Candidatus Liptonbacteria bacterium]